MALLFFGANSTKVQFAKNIFRLLFIKNGDPQVEALNPIGGPMSMKNSRDAKERRKHKRKTMGNIVVGIINHEDPETIGTIIDISQGGVKCAHNELRMTPDKSVSRSIDLITGSQYVLEVPCKSIWQTTVEKQSHNKSTIVKHCGIQFDELTPNQNFLLGKFINRCACFEEDESGKR